MAAQLQSDDFEREFNHTINLFIQLAQPKPEPKSAQRMIFETTNRKHFKQCYRKKTVYEKEKMEQEAKQFEEFVLCLSQLQLIVINGYRKAENTHDEETKRYLNEFLQAMVKTLQQIEDKKLTPKTIRILIEKSRPSQTVLEKAEPVVSPVCCIAGGLICLLYTS